MTPFNNIEFASLTDVGVRRSRNEDSHATTPAASEQQWRERGHLFVIADGMGGHAVGELASKMAVDGVPHLCSKYLSKQSPCAALRRAFTETNTNIHVRGQQNQDFKHMGTTGTALLLRPEGAWIAHVGDSRVYRIRGNVIEQLTYDHSLLWEQARRQKCRPEEIHGVPHNIIVRSLGPEQNVLVDCEGPHPVQVGDVFVMCSDGLSGPVTDEEIGAIARDLPPAEACRFLVDLANLQGGPDNITALVIRALTASEAPATTSSGPVLPKAVRAQWPMAVLGVGVLLAVLALFLTSQGLPGVMLTFVLGTLAILSGLAGLLFQARQEQGTAEDRDEPRELHVYRQTPCDIQLPILEKLARTEADLQESLREKQSPVDWEITRKHQELAQTHLNEGHLGDAFREYCRAMRPLAEAVQRERRKEVDSGQWAVGNN